MRKEELDPFAYIESAFLDKTAEAEIEQEIPKFLRKDEPEIVAAVEQRTSAKDAPQPTQPSRSLVDAIRTASKPIVATKTPAKLKKTKMRAPRPRKRKTPVVAHPVTSELEMLWQQLPKNVRFLAGVYDDQVTQGYYSTKFKESREDLIRRLVDPELNLEDTARLLGVCPATVRRYTNRGWLLHHRTIGNQRRFRLSGIVDFVEKHGRNPEA